MDCCSLKNCLPKVDILRLVEMMQGDGTGSVVQDLLAFAEQAQSKNAASIRACYHAKDRAPQEAKPVKTPSDTDNLLGEGYAVLSELHDVLYLPNADGCDTRAAITNAKHVLSRLLARIDRESGPNRALINIIDGCGSTSLSFKIPAEMPKTGHMRQVQTTSIGSSNDGA